MSTLSFHDLQSRHGDIEAMRILGMMEEIVYLRERSKILQSSPDDRFIEAVTRFEKLEQAASV